MAQPSSLPSAGSPAYAQVRAKVIGYSDAALAVVKDGLAQELDVDPSDVDCVLADHFGLERCSCCGHWFDRPHCNTPDDSGGFECTSCANSSP